MQNIFYIVLFQVILVFSDIEALEQNLYSHDRTSTSYSGRFCRHRHLIYPKEFFNDVAGQACYSYGHIKRYKNDTPYNFTISGKMYPPTNTPYYWYFGYYVQDGEKVIFSFNYKDETVKQIVAESFRKEKYYQKWLTCCEQAEECCENTMTNENIELNDDKCPAIWDGWDCFTPISSDTSAENFCPSSATMGDPPCLKTSIKMCWPNGTWDQTTDYSTCDYSTIISKRIIFHSYALFTANILCLPAIIIFFAFPALRITRVILHRNLLIAIVMKNILVIMSKMLITLDSLNIDGNQVMIQNGIPCRVLAFLERVSVNAVYACMLVDGFYLHKIIVAVFRKDPPMYWFYSAVAVLSLVPILLWAGLKAYLDNTNCWVVDESWLHWVIDGSRYAMLGMNMLLLLDIIRVLVWKLKRNNGAQHTKYYYVSIHGVKSFRYVVLKALTATLRATFILLPLFGIQFIMMSQRPVNVTCLWDDIFYYVSYTIDASQGILVSLLYCYFNKEVQTLLKRSYQKYKSGLNLRRSTINFRRTTTATYVSEQNAPRDSKSKLKGKQNLDPIPEEQVNQNTKVWIQTNFNNS